MNYKLIPTDYYEELCNKGIRSAKKAEGFLSYCINGELGHYHAVRYYSVRWEVSVSTAHGWIKEFDKEIDLWASHWQLKNNTHYSNVKKLTEQTEHSAPNKPNTIKARVDVVCETTAEQNEHTSPNKVFNKYNNNRACDERLFLDLFNIYNINTQFPGSKDKALKQYEKMYNLVDHRSLIKSVIFYLHDPSRKGLLFNLENFLKNEVYANYIPTHIRVFTSGIWMEGVYDKDTEVFTPNNAEQMRLTSDVLTNKFSKGELEFIREVAA